ncbi:MAG: hypothetical protein IKX25_10215 [Bacteroidales bacterium]|nr:hypothetical protein [Bacteroidales bacterium]
MNKRYFHLVITLLLGLCVGLFWAIAHPEALSYQEQNQLFLCTADYFLHCISIPGGITDWMAEGLTQFYFYPAMGGIVLALLFMTLQAGCRAVFPSSLLSILPALLILLYMGDFDVLLSYPVAIALTLGCFVITAESHLWLKAILTPLLAWCTGPVAILYPFLLLWQRWKKGILLLIICIISLFVSFRLLSSPQYPTFTILWGINYHRLVLKVGAAPAMQWIILIVIAVSPGLHLLHKELFSGGRNQKMLATLDFSLSLCLILVSTLPTPLTNHFYERNAYAILKQSYLIRRSAWNEILDEAKKWQQEGLLVAKSDEYCTAVNLSLAMTDRMDEHFTDYPQTGFTGLLSNNHHDNISGIPTMEAFFQMGLISEAMHYAFDMQESISNYRKSARFIRRLVECNIILGDYKVADKYLCQLEQTLFYRDWARSARQTLADGTAMHHEPWGRLRSYCLTDDEFFQPHLAAIVVRKLYLHNRGNRIARQYLMAYTKLLQTRP